MDVDSVLKEVSPFTLKPKQIAIFKALADGKNVFAILPTGYGKSASFGLFGEIMDTMHPGKKHHVLVVSPLKALMIDQVSIWRSKGVSAAAVMKDMDSDTVRSILAGEVTLLFMSPECLLIEPWWSWIKSTKDAICLLAVDEAHCITAWGDTFREDYRRIPRVRCALACPILLLTATVTEQMVSDVLEHFHLDKDMVEIITALPDRPNIHLSVVKCSANFPKEVDWLFTSLREFGRTAPKTIIYCKSTSDVCNLYYAMYKELQDGFWNGGEHKVENKLVEMFMKNTDLPAQQRILATFKRRDSHIRCVIATIAFGLGVQVEDVRRIVHWGPSKNILSYWQEVGRCSRDGAEGTATMYITSRSCNPRNVDPCMIKLIEEAKNNNCIRKQVLDFLFLPEMGRHTLEAACGRDVCCSVCDSAGCAIHPSAQQGSSSSSPSSVDP